MKLARTAAISLTTLVAALSPTAAHAASYHHSDAAHDVVTLDGTNGTNTTPAPDQTNGDILDSGVTYGPRRVTMAMRYAALEQNDDLVEHYFSVVTSKHKVREFLLIALPEKRQGSLLKLTGKGKKFTCKGVHWSIGYGARTVTVSVPARCLGKPQWVRVGMASVDVPDVQTEDQPVFLDDANGTGATDVRALRYGPRMHR